MKNFEVTNIPRKIIGDEYDSQFKDYRDINQFEKAKNINYEISELPKHDILKN